MRYATFDQDGVLTGCYLQDLHPAHADAYVELTEEQAAIWTTLEFVNGELRNRAPAPPTTLVPIRVTARQAEQALILTNKYDTVVAALAAIPGVQGELARTEWARSQFFERQRPLVLQMAQSLGWSDADLDELFILAGSLS